MRKILIFLGLSAAILLSIFIKPNVVSAGRGTGTQCLTCPRVDGKDAYLYFGAAGWKCLYLPAGSACRPPQDCFNEQRDPATSVDQCPSGQTCSADVYKGCLSGGPDPADQCILNGSETCPGGTNDQCTHGLGTTVCSKNYCVYNRGDGTLYQMTPKALSDGKTPFCAQLNTPPQTNPDDVEAPIVTNTPLSSPCAAPGPSGCTSINTALGVVFTGANNFTRWLLGFVLSISGGIVILIIIISGYRLMTSQGDPEKIKNARDQLTAAVVGLLFIIFSLVILELITRDILGLPGFGN